MSSRLFYPRNWPSGRQRVTGAEMEDAEERLARYAAGLVASPTLLDYFELSGNLTCTSAEGAKDVPSSSLTVVQGDRPTLVRFTGQFYSSSASGIASISIKEGATGLRVATQSLTADLWNGSVERILPADPGSHTYKLTMGQLITGTNTLSSTCQLSIWEC